METGEMGAIVLYITNFNYNYADPYREAVLSGSWS
jgi:hypothetical protein